MPCHAPHKNQRQVLLELLLLHGLLAESPLGSPAASLLIWFVGSAGGGAGGGGTHAPCWNSSRHFVMLFMTILYSLLLALTYFLSRTVNKTKNHFRCNVAFFVCSSQPEMECVLKSRRYWTELTPATATTIAIAIAVAMVAWNLSLSTHHLHFEHKQQDEKNPLNAFEWH